MKTTQTENKPWQAHFTQQDMDGNTIRCIETGKLYLHLKGGTMRDIGQIVRKGDRYLYYKFAVKKKHFFRKRQSWGLYFDLPDLLGDNSIIKVYADTGTYVTTGRAARENGFIEYYPHKGFERQVMVPLRVWRVLKEIHPNVRKLVYK